MVKKIVGRCGECGKDIILISPESEDEFKEYMDNEDVRGYISHIGVDGKIFHISCHRKMVENGRWDWDRIRAKEGRKIKTTEYKADLKKLLELDKRLGRFRHVKIDDLIDVQLVKDILHIERLTWDDKAKKIKFKIRASEIMDRLKASNITDLISKARKLIKRLEDLDLDIENDLGE